METEKKIEDNMRSALKQALERRQMEVLSSNFSYRMMGHIRREAEKQRKRKARISWVALLTSVLALLGLGIYFLFFYMDINFTDKSVTLQFNLKCKETMRGFASDNNSGVHLLVMLEQKEIDY